MGQAGRRRGLLDARDDRPADGRDDDYEPFGLSMSPKQRWDRLMEMLEEMKRLWAGEKRGFAGGVGPDVSDNPPKVFLGAAGPIRSSSVPGG